MLAIFRFLYLESNHFVAHSSRNGSRAKQRKEREKEINGSADVLSGLTTLVNLRLISKVGALGGGNDMLDGGARYRVHVGWELVRSLGRSLGIEVEEFVAE